MKNIEAEAKTKEEAVAKALQELNLNRAQVSVEVLEEGNRGFLGLGAKAVRVRVFELGDDESTPAEVVNTLLEMIGVEFEIDVRHEGDATNIRIDAPKDDGLLIGRRGQTLDALRHLSQRIVAARRGRNAVLNIDVGDYRARREESLRERALSAVESVQSTGRSVSLEPMSAQDRRVVHLVLAEIENLHTFTVGNGSRRRVVVAPEGGKGRSPRVRADRAPEENYRRQEQETAYDRVPDPGFRPARVSEIESDARETEPSFRGKEKQKRRERPRGGRQRGERREAERVSTGAAPTGQETGKGAVPEDSGSEERQRTRRDDSRSRRDDQRRGHDDSRPRRDDHRREQDDSRPRRDDQRRGHDDSRPRRDDQRRGHDDSRPRRDDQRRGYEAPNAGDRRGDDSWGEQTDVLSEQTRVSDETKDKPFARDLARHILRLDDSEPGKSGATARRRTRRR